MTIEVAAAEDVPQFGLLVRQHRMRIGLTQRELADFSTVSVRAIRDLEQGRARRPRQDTVRLIADGLRLGLRARADLETAANQGRTSWAVKAGYEADPPAPPIATDVLLGREAETSVLVDELASGAERLVTVVGVAGVGRTRLALEVATRLHTADRTPVLWCPVTELPAAPRPGGDRLTTLVRACVGQLLGTGAEDDDLAALVETVADRPPLLVVDGVTDADPRPDRFARLLRDCPGLRILVTADRPLDLPGERSFLLTPLAGPEPGDPVDRTTLEQAPATRLFLDRARRVRPDLRLTDTDAPLVADVCRRLDGLPLALQAAASWLVVYNVPTLHQCLHGDPADLLHHLAGAEGGIRLREALDRRLAALPAADRDLFAALCARDDGFGLPDVMALTGRSLPDSGRTVRDLVLHGLVRPSYEAGQSRFRILHLVRAAQLCAPAAVPA
ncbi:helix-turn-helix domain-containing protein [Micromonospora cathayae]|uniref:Helix-turn-helix domain-containing protein n=1 Tax=Micromonospora cathayae TaxID=3028804 RepID=A0ABY7ZKF9_9ACTN|nr:helix-turn-helix domain-containing protein [Micromonospora sp. HUAS 3]WDZ83440.1 helix-turn-helix domain-containing protein [Micromonospora sp. HUAS 3]